MTVWERCTEEARQAIFVAQQEAEALDDNYVSTEHLLVGALHNRDGRCRRFRRTSKSARPSRVRQEYVGSRPGQLARA